MAGRGLNSGKKPTGRRAWDLEEKPSLSGKATRAMDKQKAKATGDGDSHCSSPKEDSLWSWEPERTSMAGDKGSGQGEPSTGFRKVLGA